MNKSRLTEILTKFPETRIAVVGDYFLDKWLLINRDLDELSIETGLTAYQVTGKRLCPGAAGTVTNNLSALNIGEIYAVGFIGDDGEGYELLQGLRATGVNTDYLYQYESVFTPAYIKPLFNHGPCPEETHRLDIKNRTITPDHIERQVIASLQEIGQKVDAIIVLDQVTEQNTGVITEQVRETLAALSREQPNLIIYADSRKYTPKFKNIIVKCNHLEALSAVYPHFKGDADEVKLKACALVLARRMKKPVFITRGSLGIIAAQGETATSVPAINVEGPLDICGAGDSATAGIVSSLCCAASITEAALIGNLAASITIQQIGTTGTASREAIINRFTESVRA